MIFRKKKHAWSFYGIAHVLMEKLNAAYGEEVVPFYSIKRTQPPYHFSYHFFYS